MMKCLFTVWLMMCSVLLSAQSLSVSDFYLDEKDLTANTQGTTVMDQNGEKCALIKVITTNTGFTFSVGNLGVVKTEQHPSEIWVYVPNGVRKMTISHPQLGQLRDYNLPTSIEKARTYILKLVSGKVTTVVEEDDGMSYFTMKVKPANAVVMVDGTPRGLSADGILMLRLKRGHHSYSVIAGGYETIERSFELGSERKHESVELQSLISELHVSSRTEDTQIYLNDELMGTASWTGKLQAGNYIVEGRCAGHRKYTKTVQLKEKDNVVVDIPALDVIYGRLDVAYSPLDAEVYVDGKRVGTSPNVFKLMVGKHSVRLSADGYVEKNAEVVIEEENTVQISGALDSIMHKYVDLGLSVKWAICNVGASKPEEYGSYFAWGETKPQSSNAYNWRTYKWCKGSESTMTKYCLSSSKGTVDNKTTLDPEDDAAHVNWGGDWRMPTKAEQDELRTKCTWTWTSNCNGTGVAGCIVTGPNGNSIFLPASGNRSSSSFGYVGSLGLYWSSSLNSGYDNDAYYLGFGSGSVDWGSYNRYYGQSVRAVCR